MGRKHENQVFYLDNCENKVGFHTNIIGNRPFLKIVVLFLVLFRWIHPVKIKRKRFFVVRGGMVEKYEFY